MEEEAGEDGAHNEGGSSGGLEEEGGWDDDGQRRPRRSAFTQSGELDDDEIEEVLEMFSFDELKHRKAVYVEAVKRKEATEREGAGNESEADEMQRARSQRGRPGRVLSSAEKRKRSLAAEQQILKLFQRMTNKYGVTAWVFGYTTSIGKPRIGAAESVQPWWVLGKVYEVNAIRAHVAGRGDLQQEINRLEGSALDELLQKLNGPQLHSLAAFWFPKCSPSIRKFPLSGEKGSPPWWPAESRPESARVRAIVHSVINRSTALWPPQQDSATTGAEEAGLSGPEGGQEGATNADPHEAVGTEGVQGRRKRRRRCDITEYPFKCTAAGCEGHRGFVSAGGLANHRRANHPGASRGATEGTTAGGGLGGAEDAAASAEGGQPPVEEDPQARPSFGEARSDNEGGPRTESAGHNQPANESGGGRASRSDDPATVHFAATEGDPRRASSPSDPPPTLYRRRRKASFPTWKTVRRTAGTRKGPREV
ncbi:Ethylene insensitive 3 family protein [Klebsormidium nitens]|uniref:Ethylene insensitive 3 family protein n=1 Tax=Klebsormidium nitens TaxID=105231 RepID=A0A0U9HHZ5_KLENI|nr:Ethylene insensitive 3 family protein [Klebsormidium nitens]|eukprot:GAQ79417.1 Ethylene insensitive 3 family protein [Klebsormidium nitens]